MVELDLTDSGRRLTLDLVEPVLIRLDEIGGTGYQWNLVPPLPDPGLEISSTVESADATAPGGAYHRIFRLVASAPLETTVVLRRYPPWGDANDADATFEVTIETSS